MYLVDTNIWLERLLDQEKSDEVGRFLATIPAAHANCAAFVNAAAGKHYEFVQS